MYASGKRFVYKARGMRPRHIADQTPTKSDQMVAKQSDRRLLSAVDVSAYYHGAIYGGTLGPGCRTVTRAILT
jgi:hypothetical protein